MTEILTGPVPTIDLAVGRNLRRWRFSHGKEFTVRAMAEAIGEKHARLTAYEGGRNPMVWGVARKLWEFLDLNPQFLATGEGPLIRPFPTLRSLVPQEPDKARFSAVYKAYLAEFFHKVAESEKATALRSLKQFLADAHAGKVSGEALSAVAAVAHAHHQFPRHIVLVGGPAAKPATLPHP